MGRPSYDWVSQREGKGLDKAWWNVDTIVSGSYDNNTFVRRLLGHMSSQDEPIRRNPPNTVICSKARPQMGRWATWGDPQSVSRSGEIPLK